MGDEAELDGLRDRIRDIKRKKKKKKCFYLSLNALFRNS
jgi:hypothetical protein